MATDKDMTELCNVETDSKVLAQTKIINEIRRMPMIEKRWDALSSEQRRIVLGEVFALSDTPQIYHVSDVIYAKCKEWNITFTSASTEDKKAARKARLARRNSMSENVEGGEKAPRAQKTVRGGENTLVLKDKATGVIYRFKVRKKGGPKYEATSNEITLVSIGGNTVPMVFNPSEVKKSNRTGFRYGTESTLVKEAYVTKAEDGVETEHPAEYVTGKWYILDDDASHEFFSTAGDDTLELEVLTPGTALEPSDDTEGDEAPKKSRSKKAKPAEETLPESEEMEGSEEGEESEDLVG